MLRASKIPPVRPGAAAVLALLVLFLGPNLPRASAGECIGCDAPALNDIMAAEGVTLALRHPEPPLDEIVGPARDYMEIDAGDCEFHVSGPEEAEQVASWLVLRAYGEVWNCPHSKSSSTISASVTTDDRSEWSVSGKVSAGLDLGVVKAGAELARTDGGSRGISETADLTTSITAQACRRIPWIAYLRVARFRIDMTITMVQPYAWWTKNAHTGSTVHQKGTYEQVCLSATVPFERKAPLAWHVRLAEYPCADCAGFPPKDLGWFPKLPSGGELPPLPGDMAWPEAEPDTAPEPHETDDGDGDGPEQEAGEGVVEPDGLPPEAEPWVVPPVG